MFYAAKNTVTQTVEPCAAPWDFKPTENITEQIRHVKQDRQNWYQTPTTQHNFYTAVEGFNALARVSKENPVRMIGGVVGDYDIPISDQRIDEVVIDMPIKPSWIETSLGGNRRLVFMFERPLLVDGNEFAVYFLQSCEKWLNLNLLPSLDSQALTAASRLYCNGCVWRSTGHGPISAAKLQAHFVKLGLSYRSKEKSAVNIGLDLIEKEIKARFPSFNWPSEFAVGSQGPSFWIPESQSPMSAIVKDGGMLTFSAHATKMFYDWADILGKEFVNGHAEKTMAAGTDGVFFDRLNYWRQINTNWTSSDTRVFSLYLKVSCNMSTKPDNSGKSAVEKALDHIHNHQLIEGAAPFVMQRPGLITYQDKRILNIYSGKPCEPMAGKQKLGPHGNAPFISALLTSRFDPAKQFDFWMAYMKHYYESAFYWLSNPGQNITMQGGPGTGKTFINRNLIGGLVGGFADASRYIIEDSQFNSDLMDKCHWVLDDDVPSANLANASGVHNRIKKFAANQEFPYHKKYHVPCMVERTGRLGITANLDFMSSRLIGPMDNSSEDKMCLFRFIADQAKSDFQFPSTRQETIRYLRAELSCFARIILDWEVPDFVPRDKVGRYGYESYHEPTLLDQAIRTSPSAPFKELLIDALAQHFKDSPEDTSWSGNVSQVQRLILSNPLNEHMVRSLKPEQSNRYLEQIAKEGVLKCETKIDHATKTCVWTFHKQ